MSVIHVLAPMEVCAKMELISMHVCVKMVLQDNIVKPTLMNVMGSRVKTMEHALMVSILTSAAVHLGMQDNCAILRSVNVHPYLV
jgi:hypothetical protein